MNELNEKTTRAKKRLREFTARQLPNGAPDPQEPLHAVVDALLDVLPRSQAEALADALEARLGGAS